VIKGNLFLFIQNKKALLGVILLLFFIFLGLVAPVLAPYGPRQDSNENGRFPLMAEPSSEHLLGTTHAGNDILSRLIYGTRVTLSVGLITGIISTFIALTLGMLGGGILSNGCPISGW